MARLIRLILGMVLFLSATAATGMAGTEPVYLSKPLSYWIASIRNRDADMPVALTAIQTLGAQASEAVPDLAQIVGEPFIPIRIGVDDEGQVVAKLHNIDLRMSAIDGLAAIGEPAAPATPILIQWALTERVVPSNLGQPEDARLFIDIVMVDVAQRMRVAGAITQFGDSAFPAIVASLAKGDPEWKKLAVAILGIDMLPVADQLLKSDDCTDRELGLGLMVDMWPVMSRELLIQLKSTMVCGAEAPAEETTPNLPSPNRVRDVHIHP